LQLKIDDTERSKISKLSDKVGHSTDDKIINKKFIQQYVSRKNKKNK